MKIGVLGTGRIVNSIVKTLKLMEDMELYAIASRTQERADEAAKEWGFLKSYGSYEELVKDGQVELVYIATPHSRHHEDMELCIENNKPVLCEKAFTMNSKQAIKIKELAEKKQVFVAEAIWTRYMPSRKLIQEVVDSGIVGNISMMTANLCYPVTAKHRIMTPELAGGALLDVGVYGINFALMHFGNDIEKIETSVQFTDTGVDGAESITLYFKDGKVAVLTHSVFVRSDRRGVFYGDEGYIVVENINNPQSIDVYDKTDKLIKHIDIPKQLTGYEYQFMECKEEIKNKKIESISMPLSDSVFVMQVMDEIRHKWGLVYPQEKGD